MLWREFHVLVGSDANSESSPNGPKLSGELSNEQTALTLQSS
jgi:hypothetical protein